MTLKRWGSPLLSLEVCSRATASNYCGGIKDKFVCFKLKKIYFIIIFSHLWHSSIPLIQTNEPFFGKFGLYLTILGEYAVATVVTQS